MKDGKSLIDLAAEVQRVNDSKKDYLVNTDNLNATTVDNNLQISLEGDTEKQNFSVSDTALQQMETYTGIPAKYAQKMAEEYPELLITNLNSWFHKNGEQRMVRTLDGKARAFLSNRYRRIDNAEVMEAVLPVLKELHLNDDARVESCEVTEKRLYIKVVNPRLTGEVVPGDIVQSGILITNSEIGLGSVSVQPLMYRLVCSNGMIVNDARTRKYHVGRENDETAYSLFSDATLEAEDKAFVMKMQDTVRAITDQTRFDHVIELMQRAKSLPVTTNDIPKLVELTSKEFLLNKDEGDGVLASFLQSGDMSLYGMANAVTAHAQKVKSYDRSTDMESIGYDVMTLPGSKWKELNALSTNAVVA